MMSALEEKEALVEAGVFHDSPTASPIKEAHTEQSRSLSMDATSLLSEAEPLHDHHRSVSGYIQTDPAPDSPSTSARGRLSADLNTSLNNVLSLHNDSPVVGRLSPASSLSSSQASSAASELSVRVDRPEKILGAMDTFVLFRVTTRVSRGDFAQPTYSVQRRYSDFAWLRGSLEAAFPLAILPPLPGKHSLYALDRFDPIFVRARCLLLHFFLQGLAALPKASRTPDFRAFLTQTTPEWAAFRKKRDSGRGSTKLGEALAGLRLSTPANPKFDEMDTVCAELQQTLLALEKLATKWERAELTAATSLASLRGCLEHWAESDPSYRLKKSAAASALAVGVVSTEASELAENHEADLSLPIRHWALAAESVRAVLRRRASCQAAAEAAWEGVRKREAERAAVEKASGGAEDGGGGRLGKAQLALEEARSKARAAASEAQLADSAMEAEWEAWRARRVPNLAAILKELAQLQLEKHRKAVSAWEEALEAIEDAGRPVSNGTIHR